MIILKTMRKKSDEVRIGACADYLLGVKLKVIEDKWGVTGSQVCKWISRTGSFKLRQHETVRQLRRSNQQRQVRDLQEFSGGCAEDLAVSRRDAETRDGHPRSQMVGL